MTKGLTKEDMDKLLELLEEAYAEVGKSIETAFLYEGEDTTTLIDKRKKEELN